MVNRLNFPKEVRKVLSSEERNAKGTNTGLWLDKYIVSQDRNDTSSRRDLVDEVSTLSTPTIYEAAFVRWQKMLIEYRAQTRRIQVKGRMAVGLGSESLLEASISLHRTYGVPYIPGSALKGLAASYAHHCLGGEWQRGGKFHTIVFGNTDEAGYITFFDALYVPGTGKGGRALVPDVITVHHQKYYQETSSVPSDSDDPNPIPFLSATGTYLLALAVPAFQGSTRWVDITFQILAEALDKLGIGAKTSSGYGRMKFIDPPIRPIEIDPEVRKAEGYRRELEALKDVAGQIHGYYQKWQQFGSGKARKLLALAIVEKVRNSGREKVTAEKPWYKELQAFLAKDSVS